MYDGSGAMGRMDVLLDPFYRADRAAGRLTDEEAIFHIACLLLRDTCYAQLGGPDAAGPRRDRSGLVPGAGGRPPPAHSRQYRRVRGRFH